jgi:hypothetical protein
MNYRTAREILAEAARRSSSNAMSRVKATHGNFEKNLASGKETERIIDKIEANHADASKKAMDEYALARKHKRNKILHAHHMMRAEHFNTHARNYEKHLGHVSELHSAGDYRRAWSEGSHAADAVPHMRDIPHHADYHLAGYYNK